MAPARTDLSVERRWVLAASAVLTERNHERHDILGGMDRTEQNIREIKVRLKDWWSIESRDSLLATLKWLETEGHRGKFERLAAAIGAMSFEEYLDLVQKIRNDEETSDRLAIVKAHAAKLGPKGLLGWVYGRYISLCRWGYVAGYLAEQEAWSPGQSVTFAGPFQHEGAGAGRGVGQAVMVRRRSANTASALTSRVRKTAGTARPHCVITLASQILTGISPENGRHAYAAG